MCDGQMKTIKRFFCFAIFWLALLGAGEAGGMSIGPAGTGTIQSTQFYKDSNFSEGSSYREGKTGESKYGATGFLAVIQSWTSDGSGCWFCGPFGDIFKVVNEVATTVSTEMAGMFLMLLGIGVLFFLAFRIGKMLVQLQPVDLMQFLNDLFKPLFRAMIAAALLASSTGVFQYIVSPLLQGALSFSTIVMQQAGMPGLENKTAHQKEVSEGKTISDVLSAKDSSTQKKLEVSIQSSALTEEKIKSYAEQAKATETNALNSGVQQALQDNLKTVSASLIVGMATGAYLMANAFAIGFWSFLPDFWMFFIGLFFFLCYFFIFLSYPFKLFEGIFRLVFVTCLAPLWIVLWVFPATSEYTKKAFSLFLGSCLLFVVLALFISLTVNIMDQTLSGSGLSFLEKLLDGKAAEAVKALLESGTKTLFVMAILSYVCFKMLSQAQGIADGIAGATGTAINQAMGRATGAASSSEKRAGIKRPMDYGFAAVGGSARLANRLFDKAGGKRLKQNVGTKAAKLGRYASLPGMAAGVSALAQKAFSSDAEKALSILSDVWVRMKNGEATVMATSDGKMETWRQGPDGLIRTYLNKDGQQEIMAYGLNGEPQIQSVIAERPGEKGREQWVSIKNENGKETGLRKVTENGDYLQRNKDGSLEEKQGNVLKRYRTEEDYRAKNAHFTQTTTGDARETRIKTQTGEEQVIHESWNRDDNGNITQLKREKETFSARGKLTKAPEHQTVLFSDEGYVVHPKGASVSKAEAYSYFGKKRSLTAKETTAVSNMISEASK